LTINNYVKNPEPVKAIKLKTNDSLKEAAEWCGGEVRPNTKPKSIDDAYDSVLVIPSLTGPVEGSIGSYLVRTNDGKFKFWPASDFEEQYHEVGLRQDGLIPRTPVPTGPLINRSVQVDTPKSGLQAQIYSYENGPTQ